MIDWDKRVNDHPVRATIASIRERLDALGQPEDADELEAVERVRRVVGQLDSLIVDADSPLLAPALLDAAQSALEPIPRQLETYETGGDTSYIIAASGQLDALIGQVGWIIAYAAREPVGLREAAANYRRSAGQLLRSLEEEIGKVKETSDAFPAAIEAAKTDVQAAAAAAATEVTTSFTAIAQPSCSPDDCTDAGPIGPSKFNDVHVAQKSSGEVDVTWSASQSEFLQVLSAWGPRIDGGLQILPPAAPGDPAVNLWGDYYPWVEAYHFGTSTTTIARRSGIDPSKLLDPRQFHVHHAWPKGA